MSPKGCAGVIEGTGAQCRQRALWQVSGAGQVTSVRSCRYHMIDFIEQVNNSGVPAIVVMMETR